LAQATRFSYGTMVRHRPALTGSSTGIKGE